jgi:hypothetical protein
MDKLVQLLQLAAGLMVRVGGLCRVVGFEKMRGGQVIAGGVHQVRTRILSCKRVGSLEDLIGGLCRGYFALTLSVIALSDRI